MIQTHTFIPVASFLAMKQAPVEMVKLSLGEHWQVFQGFGESAMTYTLVRCGDVMRVPLVRCKLPPAAPESAFGFFTEIGCRVMAAAEGSVQRLHLSVGTPLQDGDGVKIAYLGIALCLQPQ